jgi:thiosulfate/3-mercaptopyruvate sulfurtransferase
MHGVIAPVVDASFLAEHPHAVLADVRWYLDGRDGHEAFRAGHLPGAIWIDLDTHMAAHDLPATEGRHPLPTPETFAASMSALGIGDDTIVVAYDDVGGGVAGRLVVMLRMLGRDAALLDGGLVAWIADGHPLQTGDGRVPDPAAFRVTAWPADRLADADTTAALAAAGGVVIDARAAERFTGTVTQIDPRPGHVPGARNAPWQSVVGADGRLLSADELSAHYAGLGIDADHGTDAIAYCGSGVSACLNILAIEHLGLTPPRLYVASWSGYSADPDRAAEQGPHS